MSELFKYFLILGSTGFGGPLALIQLMRAHFVDRNQKLSGAEFDQAFTLVKAMPGPIAFQMAVFCGQRLHGALGGILSGFALIFPPFLMMIAMGYGYTFFREHPSISVLLNGFQFVVAAVILLGLRSFFIQYYNRPIFWILILAAAFLFYSQLIPEPVIIIGFGLICVGLDKVKNQKAIMFSVPVVSLPLLITVFKICAYAGAFVFGTGLALIPVFQHHFVDQLHLLDLQTFNDGVTFGQMTPGPVTITATFLGFKIAGVAGAVVATVGVFLLPLFHMVTWFPRVLNWLSKQSWIPRFLMGATAAVVGVLLITIYRMNINFYTSISFWIIFLISLVFLYLRPKTSVLIVIFAGGILNLLLSFASVNSI